MTRSASLSGGPLRPQRAIAFDVGGTHLRVARVDESKGVLAYHAEPLLDRTPAAVALHMKRAAANIQGDWPKTVPVGVSLAAQQQDGVVLNAPNLGWRDEPFERRLKNTLGRRVHLENDLSAAAWGEFKCGAAQKSHSALTVFLGSGLGAAFIENGRLLRGAGGVALELGHVKVEADGLRCGCGERGCLEAYVGGVSMQRRAREQHLAGGYSGVLGRSSVKSVQARKRLADQAESLLALHLANAVTLLNPAVLVLGGGVFEKQPAFCTRVVRRMKTLVSPVAQTHLQVKRAALGDTSGLLGAAHLVFTGDSE